MSTRELTGAISALLRLPGRLARIVTQKIVRQFLRSLMAFGRRPSLQAGFVLPATVLLLLVLTLTVGSIAYRTYTRTVQTVAERQQRVIFNAATPAIDRAKAKLEYLFDPQKDPRFPSGVPRENFLLGMMLNKAGGTRVGNPASPLIVPAHRLNAASGGGYDPYTFPDETRINIGNSGEVPGMGGGGDLTDNAWRYRADSDGDGVLDSTVVYSINMRTPATEAGLRDTTNAAVRSENLQVRHGPLSNASQNNPNCPGAAGVSENGWTVDSTNQTVLRKNFQINAYVVPDTATGTVATLEVHQDRQLDRGNKWGAWFRNDLEIFPGPPFRWNGAMHTEGNLFVAGGNFTSFMISSPNSCYYTQDASEITGINVDNPAFQSQFIAGVPRDNDFRNGGRFHIFDGENRPPIINGDDPGLDNNPPRFDSVDETTARNRQNQPVLPVDFALDPVILQTRGDSVARNVENPATARVTNWLSRRIANPQTGRLQTRQRPTPPYVDDTYRADNRSGPKPNYGRGGQTQIARIGEPINEPELVRGRPGAGEDATAVGLDGYWERRARLEGLRLIVGQRLELGDPAGWGGPMQRSNLSFEPLRPYSGCTSNNSNRCNEARQRRSLWDNLAAVQATVVYHHANADPNATSASPETVLDVPLACLATTVHPGTAGTLERSATFENLVWGFPAEAMRDPDTGAYATDADSLGSNPPVISDFLRGRGTNGWEYFPAQGWSEWFDQIHDRSSGLSKAMHNLAYLAGDPNGGAPSFTPPDNTVDTVVHPYPSFAMWGDFSMLRRVLNLLDSGTVTYDNLSPADKTVLHTAACTLGMLAYNINYLQAFQPQKHLLLRPVPNESLSAITGDADTLQEALQALRTGVSPLGSINSVGSLGGNDSTAQNPNNPEVYVRLLERWRNAIIETNSVTAGVSGTAVVRVASTVDESVDRLNRMIYLAQMLISKYQVERDREHGFKGSGTGTWENATNAIANSCANLSSDDPIRSLCSFRPRYPVLYNLFPTRDIGVADHPDISSTAQLGIARDSVDSSDYRDYIVLSNAGLTFREVTPRQLASMALQPRVTRESWSSPVELSDVTPAFPTPNNNRDTLVKVCFLSNTGPCLTSSWGREIDTAAIDRGVYWRVGFKDSAIFNGREMMSVRVMDLNLDLLRRSRQGLDNDVWLPRSGVVYAFREDTVSEVNIVRPATRTWAVCGTEAALRTNNECFIRTTTANAYNSKDPPLPPNRISAKPVDYVGDPDRRPNGFRLRRGATLARTDDRGRGLSFISDNPVYIQGDFNLHRSSETSGTFLEEFNTLVDQGNPGNFYTRSGRNPNFAGLTTDLWRPTEVLADAVTILSDNFCDGSIEDFFRTAGVGTEATLDSNTSPGSPIEGVPRRLRRYGCQTTVAGSVTVDANNRSSYMTANRPSSLPALNTAGTRWMRTNVGDFLGHTDPPPSNCSPATQVCNPYRVDPSNPNAIQEGDSPIVIAPSGDAYRAVSTPTNVLRYDGGYYSFGTRPKNRPTETRVNSIIVSGIVPSRVGQSYGGLHNFPRFVEDWTSSVPLIISGSLIQLNFSQAATGPFDQDAYEPGATPTTTSEQIGYYSPPERRWGYDVGLQIAPAGPVASRFVTIPSIRSEFYSEPPADDPFIVRLANCAAAGSCGS